jgi:carbamoyl-phosphate synthase large subunit
MATVSSFRDLRVWQTAIQLATDVYQLSGDLPPNDRSELAANMQRTVTAIPTLIAGGHKSGQRAVLRAYCLEAIKKTDELETLLVICGELHPAVPSNDILDTLDDIRQSLITVITRLTPPNKPAKTL